MATSRHVVALLKSYVNGDEERFLSIAMQLAAEEARRGHGRFAQELTELVSEARNRTFEIAKGVMAVPIAQPRGELANLLSVRYPETQLNSMVLTRSLQIRLSRIIREQNQDHKLRAHNLAARRKLLFIGPPGTGKTMTASAIAGELRLPLFTILLEGLITKFMGETAGKLRVVFDAIAKTRAVYLFDEFDAIGSKRSNLNDVGEIRRVLNSFLQFLENDDSQSLIVAATNYPEALDKALFRRFDDVIEYELPMKAIIDELFRTRLTMFPNRSVDWERVVRAAIGLSQADIARASDEAAKSMIINEAKEITTQALLDAIRERKAALRDQRSSNRKQTRH